MIAAIIAAMGAGLLIVGIAMGLPARDRLRSGPWRRTPVWRMPEEAFESHRAYVTFVFASCCLAAGSLLIAISSLITVFQD